MLFLSLLWLAWRSPCRRDLWGRQPTRLAHISARARPAYCNLPWEICRNYLWGFSHYVPDLLMLFRLLSLVQFWGTVFSSSASPSLLVVCAMARNALVPMYHAW